MPGPGALQFRGSAVRLTFADDVSARDRKTLLAALRRLLQRMSDTHAGEDAVVLAIPLAAARVSLIGRLVARTAEVIEFAVSRS